MGAPVLQWLVRALCGSGVGLAVLLVAGCGFHLAGQHPLPEQLQSVYIDVENPYGVDVPPLQRALARRVVRSGGKIAPDLQTARSVLRLSHLTTAQETIAIGPDGRSLEYQLITSVDYTLAVNGKVLLPTETQTISSDYSFSTQQILAKEEEQSRLQRYIQDELAELILMRITAQLSQLPPPAGATAAP
ncbi:MAG: hypothetical protein EPN72_00065 [Nevskiaceae bacterium]|nr:MAG: hypothetical protein EPN63_09580 [Nevskiaceae bacterium]TBR75299.1 MAG: hypothetical protein EPN72_00065 [Nevskiaceae bacterium]